MDLIKVEMEQHFISNKRSLEMENKIRGNDSLINQIDKDMIALKKDINDMKEKIIEEPSGYLEPSEEPSINLLSKIESVNSSLPEKQNKVESKSESKTQVIPKVAPPQQKVQKIVMSSKTDTKELKIIGGRVTDVESRLLAMEDKSNKMLVSLDKLAEITQHVNKKADIIDVKMVQSEVSNNINRRGKARL